MHIYVNVCVYKYMYIYLYMCICFLFETFEKCPNMLLCETHNQISFLFSTFNQEL